MAPTPVNSLLATVRSAVSFAQENLISKAEALQRVRPAHLELLARPHLSELAGTSAVCCGAGSSNGLSGTELGGSWLLPRAVGTSNSAEILLTGKKVDAEEALRIGLVTRVVPDEEVLAQAKAMAERMCAFSPFGLALTKDTIWTSLEVASLRSAVDLENRTQLLAGHTGNLTEASAAFKDKRPPVYTE